MKKTIAFVWKLCLVVLAIGILYCINVGSPDLNRAGQEISGQ
jgi:hypothetical protein